MSWQKCMSFWKCSNLEVEKVIDFKAYQQRDKKSNYNSHKQNLENKPFQMGFMHLKIKIEEKFKLKTKLTKTKIKIQSYTTYVKSFQLPKAV